MPVYSTPRRIIVKRMGAMGDVLEATPILARLHDENPDAEIGVLTQYPVIFERTTFFPNPSWAHYTLYDLDNSYEKRHRKKHGVDCYSLDVFGDERTPKQLYLKHDRRPCDLPVGLEWDRVIGIHPARSWPQRTLPIEFWQKVVAELVERGWQVMVFGTQQDWLIPDADNVFNTQNQITLRRQAFFIDNCAAFICSDTGLMNLAFTTKVPVVALLTMTLPELAEHVRYGKLGWGFYPMVASVPCAGCSARLEHVVPFFECMWSDERRNYCVNTFSPSAVVHKAITVAKQHKQEGLALKYA